MHSVTQIATENVLLAASRKVDALADTAPACDASDGTKSRRKSRARTPQTGFSLDDLADRWRVSADEIRAWLQRGELVGVNVATTMSGRPMWRIPPEGVTRFEQRRSSTPAPRSAKRRRRSEIVDCYP
jgi:hypothetical protein